MFQRIKNLINRKRLLFLNLLISSTVDFNQIFVALKFNLKKLKFFDSIYEKKFVTKKKRVEKHS